METEKALKLSSNSRKRSFNCDRKHPKAKIFSPADYKILLLVLKKGHTVIIKD